MSTITIIVVAIIVVGAGYLGYKHLNKQGEGAPDMNTGDGAGATPESSGGNDQNNTPV